MTWKNKLYSYIHENQSSTYENQTPGLDLTNKNSKFKHPIVYIHVYQTKEITISLIPFVINIWTNYNHKT